MDTVIDTNILVHSNDLKCDYGAHGEAEKKMVHEYMVNELGLDILNSEQAKARFYLSNE